MNEQTHTPTHARVWTHLGLVMGLTAVIYLTHSLLRYWNFEAKGFDLGIFDQAVRQYSLFKAPIVPLKGEGFHLLGDHFHPILALLAPFYWIWDDPRMLNIIMTLCLVSVAIPVYFFTRRRANHTVSILAAVALLLWWPFQAMVNWDFHEVTLGVPVIAWVIWAIDGRRYWLATGLSMILLFVREDMGITLVAIALVLLIRKAWAQAAVTAVAGLVGFYLAVRVIIPYFSPTGEFAYWEYTALGPDLTSSLLFMVTHPFSTIGILFDHPLKIGLWLLHFVPLLLLPFLSPYTLMAAPLLLSRLFNDRLNLWAPVYQYDAIISVVFFMAAIEATQRVVGWWNRRRAARDKEPVAAAHPSRPYAVAPGVVLIVTLLGTFTFLPIGTVFPFQKVFTADYWTHDAREEAFAHAVSLIPADECVEVADNAAPHLTPHAAVGLHGTLGDDLSTWLIIDDTVEELGGNDPLTPEEAFARAERLGFEEVWNGEGLWVYHRDQPVDPVCSEYLHR